MDWKAGQPSPFEFKRTGDEDFPRWIKALVLGPPKSGKTTFISTFPNVVVADVEAGLMSIAHKNVPYVTIDQAEKLQTLLFVLRDPNMRAKAAEQMGLEKIDTVAIDTMDALQDLFKKERLATERRTQFEQKDWGWLLDQFRELIRAFVALPMHTILTVHTKSVQTDEGKVITQPGLQGAIAEEIAGMVGFSMLMHRTREVDPQTGLPYTSYHLQVEGDDSNPHLGNRAMGRLSGTIEPTFEVLHKAIYEGLELDAQQSGQVDVDGGQNAQPVPQQAPVQQAPAQQAPQPEAQPQQPEQVQPQGAPPSDDDQPVNSAALQHVERMLGEWGFRLPDNVNEWTMGFARAIARMFVAYKEDLAAGNLEGGQEQARKELEDFLKSMGAWQDPDSIPPDGRIENLLAWVGDDPERAKIALERERSGKGRKTAIEALEAKLGQPAQPAQAPEPESAPEPEPTPEPEAPAQSQGQPEQEEGQPEPQQLSEAAQNGQGEEITHEQAVQTIKDELGAEEVTEAAEGQGNGQLSKTDLMRIENLEDAPPCQESGNPIDDLDIAKLSLSRFGKWLCVDEYIAETKKAKA